MKDPCWLSLGARIAAVLLAASWCRQVHQSSVAAAQCCQLCWGDVSEAQLLPRACVLHPFNDWLNPWCLAYGTQVSVGHSS